MPPAILSGLGGEDRAQLDRGPADGDTVAELEVEAGEKRRIGGGTVDAVAGGEDRGGRHRRLGRQRADRRIIGPDRLQLDEGRALVPGRGHGAGEARDPRPGHVIPERSSPAGSPRGGSARRSRRRRGSFRPSRASPSESERDSEATPAMVATPMAMQASSTVKPRKPPRNSRNARRRVSGRRDGRPGVSPGSAGRLPCMDPTRSPSCRSAPSAAAPCGRTGGRGRDRG